MTIQSERQPNLQFDPISGRVNDASNPKQVRLYGAIHHGLSTAGHIAWLTRVDNSRNNQPFFYHQPWEHIRKLYRDEGDMDAVREVNMAYDKAKAEFDAQVAKPLLKPFIKVRNVLYEHLAGHGHKLFRVVPWMAAAMLLFCAWSWVAYHNGSIEPTNARVYMNTCYLKPDTPCEGWEHHVRTVALPGTQVPGSHVLIGAPDLQLPAGYPAFHSVLYTLDTFIPFADLHQEADWTVIDDGPWGEWTRLIFSVFIGISGVLSAIFAAAMFSLIRKS